MLENLMKIFGGNNPQINTASAAKAVSDASAIVPSVATPEKNQLASFFSKIGQPGQQGNDYGAMFKALSSSGNPTGIKPYREMDGKEKMAMLGDLGKQLLANSKGQSLVGALGNSIAGYTDEKKKEAKEKEKTDRESFGTVYDSFLKDRAYGLDQNKFGMEKDKFGFDKEKFGKEYGLKEKEMGIDSAYKQGMLSNAAANTEVSRAALDKSTLGNDINALIAQGVTKEEALDIYKKMHTTAGAYALDPRTKAILDADNAALTKQSPEAVRARVDALMGAGQQGSGVGNAMGAPAPQQMPAAAIQMLKKNPGLAQAFDQKYGAGASAQYIGK